MSKHDKAYQLAVKTKKPTDSDIFHQLRSKVSNQLDTTKIRHIETKLDEVPDACPLYMERA